MSASTDRNLLFGILAVQLDFVSKDDLIAAMSAWLLDKGRPLGDILHAQGHLPIDRLHLLTALVAEHLKRHGDDSQKSLAALSSVEPVLKRRLAALADAAVQASVLQVGADRAAISDPFATVAQPTQSAPIAGRYRILRPHAKGGLGEVFVAEDMELGRHIALKEIQTQHADRPEYRSRFMLEAEITGGLEHPGIVPVYGLGSYSDGRPFYAMRFIKGDNLKDAIHRFHAGPSLRFDSVEFRQLLGRFVDVCNAVGYAHSRGVLHRDLKPGNIMLGKYGETLVVDWGLAKTVGRPDVTAGEDATLRPRSGTEPSHTVAGQAIGTPAYMAPEQAAGRLDELGPAADIYSLGATLYELLTGQVAFPKADLAAIQRGDFAPLRQVEPGVPRPLEAVCLKAMSLKPAARYATAQALAADVERWLADEPMTAYREPLSARAWRWARRHRAFVGGTSWLLLTVTLALGVGFVLVRRERDEKEVARQYTRATLNELTDWMLHSKSKSLGQKERALLAKVRKYYSEFAASAGTAMEARQSRAGDFQRLGRIHQELGDVRGAVDCYRTAVALYSKLAVDYPAVPDYRQELATCEQELATWENYLKLLSVESLQKLERGVRAKEEEAGYRAALPQQEKLAADNPDVPAFRQQVANTHNNLGHRLLRLGKRTEAEAEYRAALVLQEKLAADHPAAPEYRQNIASSHRDLGALLELLGKRTEAEAECRAALVVNEKLAASFPAAPEYRGDLARSYRQLGILHYGLGKRPEAEAGCRAAVAVNQRAAADFPARPECRRDLALSYHDLGSLLAKLGKYPEAETAGRAALAIDEKLAAEYPTMFGHNVLDQSRLRFLNLLARVGDHAKASAAAQSLADAKDVTAHTLYAAAGVFALSSAAVKNDAALSDHYAARAVVLLRQAFAKPSIVIDYILLVDPDLAPIRSRPDYIDLLWDLADGRYARLPPRDAAR